MGIRCAKLILAFGVAVGASVAPAHAGTPRETCGEVDFRPRLGKPRDQGSTAWCFAHTAADLISFQLGKRVSAFDLATQATLGELGAIAQSADPAIAGFLRRNPGRLNTIAESRLQDRSEQNSYNILGASGIVAIGGTEDTAVLLANVKGLCLEENLPSGPKAVTEAMEAIRVYHLQRARKPARPEELKPIGAVQEIEARRKARTFVSYVDHACAPREKTEALIPRLYEQADSVESLQGKFRTGSLTKAANRERMFELVNRALDAGIPVAIGYDGFELQKPQGDDDFGDHSSIVAARKWDGVACAYFVRDSYGPGCDPYRKKFRARCEAKHGGTWVRETELETVFSVVHLL